MGSNADITAHGSSHAPTGGDPLTWVLPGKTWQTFTAGDNHPPSSNYANFNVRNNIGTLDFQYASIVDIAAMFVGVVPVGAYFPNGLSVQLAWASTSVFSPTSSVYWNVALDNVATHVLTSDFYGTSVSLQGSPTTVAGPVITTLTLPVASLQGIAPLSAYKLKITRKRSDTVNDTFSDIVSVVTATVGAV